MDEKQDLKKTIGKKIRQLRKKADMTQEDLQRALGYNSNGMISQVESGSKGMSVEQVITAARFFGVHPAVLFSDVELCEEELELFQKLHEVISTKGPFYESIKMLLKAN